jgi:membrane-bound lytic murein transglycosylase MltF
MLEHRSTFTHPVSVVGLVILAVLLSMLTVPAGSAEDVPSAPGRIQGELPFKNPPWTGDFDGMVQRRHVRALVVYSKTLYVVDRGKQYGAAYEILKAFENHINTQAKTKRLKMHVVFVPTSRDDLIPALLEGRGDIAAAALTITPERRKQVDFSAPLVHGINEIAVTGLQSPAIATLADLAGQEVFVRRSSSYWEHLERLNERFAAEGKPAVQLRPVPEELEDEDLLEMVNAGLLGIVIVDDYAAKLWANVYQDLRLHPEIAVHSGGEFAWMMRPGSPQLKSTIDAFVKTHAQGTAFGNTIIKRYAQNPKFVKQATAPEEIKKFQNTVALFRQYSDRYTMDYLLMMAQGYQESRLDHNAKSAVGAIGVMQIMPATGKELQVGDITRLEPNIHGGVKYIRFIVDQYFEKEPMDPLNKGLFAFAAYNAGPGRIQQLRREAARRGLDPNKWFNNVEAVAAEKIGTETVTYVSNIYKYYIAYKLVTEQEEERRKARDTLQKEQG